ncbi:inhibitor of Bruton tyrosine kinase-like, partial [Agrilus planipennis]|uniref:Inhibitor of Bruton tyrosine kinase-like n=1 Tax=Agrilus planipennis TaxID=224129 RepID=A0A7F5RNN5_AGRPL
LWRETYPQFSKCVYSISRGLKVTHVALNDNEVLFVTNTGEAFQGNIKPRKGKPEITAEHQKKSVSLEFPEKGDCQMLKLKKIPRIHRGLAIYSDLKGLNFAVLQTNPRTYQRLFPNISPSLILEDMRFLLEKADEEDDIHDVIFKVNNYKFPAHKYICALASNKLEGMFSDCGNNAYIEIENESEYIFASLLSYIYTGACDLLDSSKFKECCNTYSQSLKKHDKGKEKEAESIDKYSASPNTKTISCKDNPLFALRDLAKKLGLKELFRYLEGVTFLNGIPKFKHLLSECRPRKPKKELLPQFYDVHIMSKDQKQISAHKCILVARIEYFESLFSVRWSSNSSPKKISLPFPHAVLDLLIDYLYTDEVPPNVQFEVDLACNLLIAADHFLLERLKEICELAISSHLSLKNVAQLIQFSYDYNACQLKDCCMEFILQNLPALLELHTLEAVDENILVDLSEFYSKFNRDISHRVLTPYSNAPCDDDIVFAENHCSITFTDPGDDEIIVRNIPKSAKKRNRTRKSSGNSFRKELPLDEIIDNSLNCNYDKENSNDDRLETDNVKYVFATKQGDAVKNRVETIMNAKKTVSNDIDRSSSTMLPLRHEDDLDEEEFPYLGKCTSHNLLSQSPGKSEKGECKLKFTKLSQKQRKRLSSECSTTEKEVSGLSVSPKNPWKILRDPNNLIDSLDVKSTIDSIITDEKKMKENFVKMKTKSLFYTQIEDHAIEDLLKFYNADKVYDEIITVARVQNTVIASPLWIHSNRSKT